MDDEGLFGSGSVTWRVHTELVMWVAGIRALYLQSLHPAVMRGTYQNSALFDSKRAWARFLRTTEFVTIRTYGTTDAVEAAASRVRRIHSRLTGLDPDTGERFRLDEPDLLRWVHCAEIGSYLDVASRAGIVTDSEADRYVAEHRAAAEIIGLDPDTVPGSRRQLAEYFDELRGELYVCKEARLAMLRSYSPPLPPKLFGLRLGVPAVNTLAFSSLPGWARRRFGVPALPGTDTVVTAQLRAIRAATKLVSRSDVDARIAESRQAARDMANGEFVSILSGGRSPRTV